MQNIAVGERYPDITRLSPILKPSAYGAAIIDFLDRVTYKVMRSEHDCECVFKVRHDAYFDAGHISAAGDQRFEDAFDRDPTFFNIGVHVDGELAACLRLNCLTAGGSQSPTLITHSGLLVPFLNMGLRITDSTRFCAVKGASDRYKLLPFAAIRLSGLHAAHYQTALVASSVQNRHLPFYARFLGSKVMEDEETVSKGLTMRVRLTLANIAEIRRSCYVDRQFSFHHLMKDGPFSKTGIVGLSSRPHGPSSKTVSIRSSGSRMAATELPFPRYVVSAADWCRRRRRSDC